MPQRPVREIIAHQPPLKLTPHTTVQTAAKRMATHNVGAALVVDHDRLAGILTEHDVVRRVVAAGLDAHATRVADVMTADPRTIDADRPFEFALLMMQEGGFRHVPVVADAGHVAAARELQQRRSRSPALRAVA